MHDSWELFLHPHAAETFLTTIWGREPFHIQRDDASRFAGLMDLDRLDELLASGLVLPAQVELWSRGSLLAAERPSPEPPGRPGGAQALDLHKVYETLHAGGALILRQLHRHVNPLRQLCLSVQASGMHEVDAHAVLRYARRAPPPLPRLAVEADTLIVQIVGRQTWTTADTLATQTVEFQLQAGDTLHLPAGRTYVANLDGAVSLHVAVQIRRGTVHDGLRVLFDAALANLRHEPELQQPLPSPLAGQAGPNDVDAALAAGLARVLAELHVSPLQTTLLRGVAMNRPAPLPRLGDLAALEELSFSHVCHKNSVPVALDRRADGSLGVSGGGEIVVFPPWFEGELDFLLRARQPFRVGDIPHQCSSRELLALCKSLVVLGLLCVET